MASTPNSSSDSTVAASASSAATWIGYVVVASHTAQPLRRGAWMSAKPWRRQNASKASVRSFSFCSLAWRSAASALALSSRSICSLSSRARCFCSSRRAFSCLAFSSSRRLCSASSACRRSSTAARSRANCSSPAARSRSICSSAEVRSLANSSAASSVIVTCGAECSSRAALRSALVASPPRFARLTCTESVAGLQGRQAELQNIAPR
mmetsp:Transcript_45088/g.101488  ORF Transcript_45088/g.101488 Transcript_45088/m.101488 type:complete len:209 (+) Transcript_45088:286-912(+)